MKKLATLLLLSTVALLDVLVSNVVSVVMNMSTLVSLLKKAQKQLLRLPKI